MNYKFDDWSSCVEAAPAFKILTLFRASTPKGVRTTGFKTVRRLQVDSTIEYQRVLLHIIPKHCIFAYLYKDEIVFALIGTRMILSHTCHSKPKAPLIIIIISGVLSL